jgi:hypothetical protein
MDTCMDGGDLVRFPSPIDTPFFLRRTEEIVPMVRFLLLLRSRSNFIIYSCIIIHPRKNNVRVIPSFNWYQCMQAGFSV